MQTKIAVVFGGTGFIGRHIVNRLVRAGYTVRVPTRSLGKAEPLRAVGVVGQVTPIVMESDSPHDVARVLAGAAVAVNAIGILAENSRQRFDAVHADMAGLIARGAVTAGVRRFVHVSAIGADGNAPSAYARSKAAGEGMVRALFPPATILRPSIVFGAGDSFFNRFARMAMLAPALPLIGGGRTRFQPVAASDVAAAVLAAIENPAAQGQTYELGGPAVYTFKGLMQMLLHTINRPRFLLSLPWGVARTLALVTERLPGQILTRDQVALLGRDNVVSNHAPTLNDLGITPVALEFELPQYLAAYRAA